MYISDLRLGIHPFFVHFVYIFMSHKADAKSRDFCIIKDIKLCNTEKIIFNGRKNTTGHFLAGGTNIYILLIQVIVWQA